MCCQSSRAPPRTTEEAIGDRYPLCLMPSLSPPPTFRCPRRTRQPQPPSLEQPTLLDRLPRLPPTLPSLQPPAKTRRTKKNRSPVPVPPVPVSRPFYPTSGHTTCASLFPTPRLPHSSPNHSVKKKTPRLINVVGLGGLFHVTASLYTP